MPVKTAERVPSCSPAFEPPKYVITVGHDNSLQWDPPPKSKELGFALSYYFPEEVTMVEKMQAALRKWRSQQLRESIGVIKEKRNLIHRPDPATLRNSVESGTEFSQREPHINIETENKREASAPRAENLLPRKRSKVPGLVTWRVVAENKVATKPTEKAHSKEERREAWKNRGKACEYHRRRKQKCHPLACSQNLLHVDCQQSPPLATDELSSPEKTQDCAKSSSFSGHSLSTLFDPVTHHPSGQFPSLSSNESTCSGLATPSSKIVPHSAKTSVLRSGIAPQVVEICQRMQSNPNQAKGDDSAHPYSQMASQPICGLFHASITGLQNRSIQTSAELSLFERDMMTEPYLTTSLPNDQAAPRLGTRASKSNRQSEKGFQASSQQIYSSSATESSVARIEPLSPYFGAPEAGLDILTGDPEDEIGALAGDAEIDSGTSAGAFSLFHWPSSPVSYYPIPEYFLTDPVLNILTEPTRPCMCSCDYCLPIPLSFLVTVWDERFDEPFYGSVSVDVDILSKLVKRYTEDGCIWMPRARHSHLHTLQVCIRMEHFSLFDYLQLISGVVLDRLTLAKSGIAMDEIDLLALAFSVWTISV